MGLRFGEYEGRNACLSSYPSPIVQLLVMMALGIAGYDVYLGGFGMLLSVLNNSTTNFSYFCAPAL